ncbi:MAG TPA: hypothetical protein VM695_10015 [Phycisphaerae bacterium]|nr:hypothetical protein [Phycisphaerae bacterium]
MKRLWPVVNGRRVRWEYLTGLNHPSLMTVEVLRLCAKCALKVDDQIERIEIVEDDTGELLATVTR